MKTLIGNGKTACIYTDGTYAYKVFDSSFPKEYIDHEKAILREVNTKTNLPIPSVYGSDASTIKMDYLKGVSLGDRMRKEKYKFACEDLIELQCAIHKHQGVLQEQAHEDFAKIIRSSDLKESLKEIGLRSLNKVPKGDSLCHFDLHPLNIMFDGEDYHIIDWMNAKNGHPILDIARTYIILRRVVKRFSSKYLTMMTRQLKIKKEDVYQAIPCMALLRLIVDQAEEDQSYLLALVEEYQSFGKEYHENVSKRTLV